MSKGKKPKAVETREGVKVVFPGRELPPLIRPPKKRRCCPLCGTRVKSSDRYGNTPTCYLFRCPKCVDRETCRPTCWKESIGS